MNNLDIKNLDFKNMSQEDIDKMNEYLESCTGNCESCGKDCGSQVTPRIAKATYALFSGKGGTGKSVVTALLACALQRRGLSVGIIDADVASPCIPHMFGVKGKMDNDGEYFTPYETKCGVRLASMGLTPNETDDPCILNGKDQSSIASYFWMGGKWEMPDCILIDMPSGIGDIPLNTYTILPLDGTFVVTNPGTLCARIARKSINLIKMLLLPVTGVIENMSSGETSSLDELHDPALNLLAKIPYDPEIAMAADLGKIDEVRCDAVNAFADVLAEKIRNMPEKK